MEMTHQSGAEAESLLRPDQRNAVLMPGQKPRWEADGEQAPFLRNEPVKLTPAWEGTNLPNDMLNLKDISVDLGSPPDRWHLIYLTLVLHGLGTLTAWNMFITAKDYFEKYKLVDAPKLAQQYLTYIGWASQIPNLLFSWFNVFVQIKGSLTTRIVWSLMIEVALFVFTVILAMMDTSRHPEPFFWCTMLTAFLLNTFNAIFQNSVYGVAARLPAQYTGAVVLGSNICGTLVVLLSWSSQLFESPRTSAIYYFIGGMFVLLMCFDTYFALPLNRFYRYYDTLQQRAARSVPARGGAEARAPALGGARATPPYCLIFRQSSVQLYNIFITFFATLTVFPAVLSEVKPVQEGFLGDVFVLISCFLTFNLTATIGNITASWWKSPSPNWLALFTTLRLLFIPCFLICNYQVQGRTMQVMLNNDWVYWVASAVHGWSSGHCSSLGMMYVGGTVAPEHSSTAGMIGAATLVTGIVSGITFSWVCPRIVTLSYWTTI